MQSCIQIVMEGVDVMILKITGVMVAVLTSSYIGYMQGKKQKDYLEVMESFKRCLMAVRDEISYAGTPLLDIFKKISQMKYEESHIFFKELSEQMKDENNLEGNNLCMIWNRVCDKSIVIGKMNYEDKMIHKRIGVMLGTHDLNSQVNAIDLYIKNISVRIEFLQRNIYERVKLCHVLGVSAGLFLAILII